jgi:xanthine dehydrogenase accessory factor
VIRVVGSAPRPVGARLVVSSAGRMAGSVRGGCVETAVDEEMMDLLGGGPPRQLHFGITDDMIWDVGLACGGTIDLFLHRLEPVMVATLREAVARGEAVALATFVSGDAAGATLLVTAGGVLFTPDQPGPELAMATVAARELLAARAGRGEVQELAPGLELFVEPFLPPPVLILVGAVHVAMPLTRFAKELGFRVVVVDPRAKFANRERFPEADEVWVEWPDEALAHLKIDAGTFIVLLTHDPKIDEPTLAAALKTGAAYIGAIGSRKTHADRFERMARWGVTAEELRTVYAPIGLDLGGRTPEETALSIIAEVVAVKNGRSGASLRDRSGPIGGKLQGAPCQGG